MKMSKTKDEIIRLIQETSGKWSPHQIFRDWITCLAIAVQNCSCLRHNDLWHSREQKYSEIMSQYDDKEKEVFAEMTALLQTAMSEEISDILGDIYMNSNGSNKFAGQFFTPFRLSVLDAELTVPQDYSGTKILNIHEPSCGAGGKILAVAYVLKNKSINYQRNMCVVAQDLDWLAVYMTYVQLSFYGIDAVVVQGDTLAEPYSRKYPPERVMRTPRNMGVLL